MTDEQRPVLYETSNREFPGLEFLLRPTNVVFTLVARPRLSFREWARRFDPSQRPGGAPENLLPFPASADARRA
jgi:hypothetical protein